MMVPPQTVGFILGDIKALGDLLVLPLRLVGAIITAPSNYDDRVAKLGTLESVLEARKARFDVVRTICAPWAKGINTKLDRGNTKVKEIRTILDNAKENGLRWDRLRWAYIDWKIQTRIGQLERTLSALERLFNE
jgi:hypothetical protein